MKFVVILGDGMADYPIPELGGLTPLQSAHKPHLDRLARVSELGMVRTIPQGLPPGSDVANMSVLGYDPMKYYTGRSPLEAISLGLAMGDNDLAFRCNLVTLSDEESYADKSMVDYSAGEISSAEAAQLIQAVNEAFASETFAFHPGISYRHCLIWKDGEMKGKLTPPHDITGRRVGDYLPKGQGGEILLDFMIRSTRILTEHPVNKDRMAKGLNPATSIWLWGEGRKPALPSFKDTFGVAGSMVCAVDLLRGLGICAGLDAVSVPGATGNVHTNYAGKGKAALKALEKGDFVYIHVEAPDEAGHQGNLQDKVYAIEAIDEQIVGPIEESLRSSGEDFRLLVLPDHPTPLSIRTHTAEPVPYMIFSSSAQKDSGLTCYDEETARSTGVFRSSGPELMTNFING